MFSPIRSSMATMARTEVVLPVPGPPVRRRTPWRAAISTARRWAGAWVMSCSAWIWAMIRSTFPALSERKESIRSSFSAT